MLGGREVSTGLPTNDIWLIVDRDLPVPPPNPDEENDPRDPQFLGSPRSAQPNWLPTTAAWSPRIWHAAAAFDDRLWVLGGLGLGGRLYDAWASADGYNWSLVSTSLPFETRFVHGVEFDGRLWIMGGEAGAGFSTVDGIDWVATGAPFSALHGLFVQDAKLFAITPTAVYSKSSAGGAWEQWQSAAPPTISVGLLHIVPRGTDGFVGFGSAGQLDGRIVGPSAGTTEFTPEKLGRFYLYERQ